ncbi:50S ribosomal protein L32e [Candidatus Woesearchaeota archaeon]|nr:MAG: 50S ribosomal protein L32e [Candidatus Woesearchaeota archaeon]
MDLLQLRKIIKKKKPSFLRQEAHVRAKLKNNWRQPKGLHSKMRRKLKSYRKMPSTGYSSPKGVRGLHPTGLREVKVLNVSELDSLDKTKDGVLIGRVGKRKRVEILKKAIELKLPILNIKDVQSYITKVEEELKKKKSLAKSREEKKKKSKEEALKKAEEKKKKEESLEDKADKEKDEKRKVLESKNETY